MQINFQSTGRSSSGGFPCQSEIVDSGVILRTLQTVQKSDHALVIAGDRGINGDLGDAASFKVMLMKAERADLQTGFAANFSEFGRNKRVAGAHGRKRILKFVTVSLRSRRIFLDIAGPLDVSL